MTKTTDKGKDDKKGNGTKGESDNGNSAENNSKPAIKSDGNPTQFQFGKSLVEGDGIKAVGKLSEKGFVTEVEKIDSSKSLPMPLDKQILVLCERRGYEYRGCVSTSGGQGAIYRVYHPSLMVEYAVKLSYTDEEEARFISEAQILRQYAELNAKDICKLIDVQPRDGEIPPAIIMEFIDGVTLHKFRLESYPEFSEEDKQIASYRMLLSFVRIANDLALGHRNKIWHRDIKPANIIVTNPGIPKKIGFKVVDLGIGKNPNNQLTIPASVFGTPVYMSPEQIDPRNKIIDNSTDIFAMGLVLFFIVTGEEFYDGILDFNLDILSKFYAIHDIMREVDDDGELVPFREDRLGIIEDEEMLAIIRNATVFSKEARYHTMDLMISPLCIRLNKLQKINQFPVTKTYYDFFNRQSSLIKELNRSIDIKYELADPEEYVKTTTPAPVPDKTPISVFDEEDVISDETLTPDSTRGFSWGWIVVGMLLVVFGGYFGTKYLTWRTGQKSHKIVPKKDVAPIVVKKVVKQPMKKVVVVNLIPVKAITKPPIKIVVAKPIPVKKLVLNFETFRKKCEKESAYHSSRVKCMRLAIIRGFRKSSTKRYKMLVRLLLHYCKASKASYCIELENTMAVTGVLAADKLISSLKAKCLAENGKSQFYKDNPSALLFCIREYTKDINDIELEVIIIGRVHKRFCLLGYKSKRAFPLACKQAKQHQKRLLNKRWKHRNGK